MAKGTRKRQPSPPGRAPRGASGVGARLRHRLQGYLVHHRQTLVVSLQRLLATPVQTLLTVLVVAIALALPAALYTAVANLNQLAGGIHASARMTLFLAPDVSESAAIALVHKLETDPLVKSVTYISKDQALAEFRELSGFGDVLDMLDENPLPAVMQVQPDEKQINTPGNIEALTKRLMDIPEVDEVAVDMAWLQRLQILLEAGRKLALSLGAALGLGVLLVMGNTIRLAIESRREEIIVVKLIGGTDSYMRRPFLYTGLWYGLGGGILAWMLVWVGILAVSGAIERLAASYQSSFVLAGPGLSGLLTLAVSGALLGLIGAWLAVAQHARSIEPE